MRILVTGTDGYIGSVLGTELTAAGHTVVGLDSGFYRDGCLYDAGPGTTTLRKDVRHVNGDDLGGFDAAVHLAELSNDPLSQQDPGVTHEINHRGSVRLASLVKAAGIQRFIYSSSCSVYGFAEGGEVDETSPVNPQTAYAECKVLVEQDVARMADDRFSPVFLRNATAFGPSPRMRFDIVLNNLAGVAWTSRVIKMISDGTPWRPLVHVRDICRAVQCALVAPRHAVHNQVYNVGSNSQNYRVREIAEIVGQAMPGCEISFGARDGDNRSYRVNFDKIASSLPGFSCACDARAGAAQLAEIFGQIGLGKDQFEAAPFTRLKQIQLLQESGRIDKHYFWVV
jgi:nucleoside-diphosphate-sugar epimerase